MRKKTSIECIVKGKRMEVTNKVKGKLMGEGGRRQVNGRGRMKGRQVKGR